MTSAVDINFSFWFQVSSFWVWDLGLGRRRQVSSLLPLPFVSLPLPVFLSLFLPFDFCLLPFDLSHSPFLPCANVAPYSQHSWPSHQTALQHADTSPPESTP